MGTISVNAFRQNTPDRYERVGAMIEDFICNHTSIQDLAKTHRLSSYSVNFFIQQYFGKPDQPFIVDIKLDIPKAKPIPVELSELYTQYLKSIDESEKLREAIEKFETANR
jgi:hypothetical protein